MRFIWVSFWIFSGSSHVVKRAAFRAIKNSVVRWKLRKNGQTAQVPVLLLRWHAPTGMHSLCSYTDIWVPVLYVYLEKSETHEI